MGTFSSYFRAASTPWQRVVARAERLVGYPTSFMSLRHLLSDEVAQVAVQLRRLVGSEHPLLRTARGLLGEQKRGSQTRGLLLLLFAKAAAAPASPGILGTQRSLAEVLETIHTAGLIHRGILEARDNADLQFGNRLATLSGDFLLASASTGLADLGNTHVVEWMSAAIGDLVQAEFLPLALAADRLEGRCGRSGPVAPRQLVEAARGLGPGDWEDYVALSQGSLLSAALRSAMALAEGGEAVQAAAGNFGLQWARLHALAEELKLLQATEPEAESLEASFGLCPRPGLAHILLASRGEAGEASANQLYAWGRRPTEAEPQELQECRRRIKEAAEEAKAALERAELAGGEGKDTLCGLVDTLVS